MSEGPDGIPAETPTASVGKTRKRPSASTSLLPTHPPPKATRKEFWMARLRDIPSFKCDPWEFYEPFLKLGSGLTLVLCNNGTEIRVMKIFDIASGDQGGRPLLQVQHPNFVDIHEIYVFEDVASVFTEYIGFSIEDLLLRSIYPTEREIAYIISQVSHISSFFRSTFVNIAAPGCDKLHPFQETRSPMHFNRQYLHLFERRG